LASIHSLLSGHLIGPSTKRTLTTRNVLHATMLSSSQGTGLRFIVGETHERLNPHPCLMFLTWYGIEICSKLEDRRGLSAAYAVGGDMF
jgi:hypothetical protein